MKKTLIISALAVFGLVGIAVAQSASQIPHDLRFLRPLLPFLQELGSSGGLSSSVDSDELNTLVGKPASVSCSQGSEFGSIITSTVTLLDAEGAAISSGGWVILSLSTDAAGKTLVTSSTDFEAAPTAATNSRLTEMGAASVNDMWIAYSTAAGVISFTGVQDGNETSYLTVAFPSGLTAACLTLDFD